MGEKIKRLDIYRYVKSRKLIAVSPTEGMEKRFMILDLAPEMTNITGVRSMNYFKKGTLENTSFKIEVGETKYKSDGKAYEFSHRFIRILSPEDMDQNRWMETNNLDQLPVSPERDLTEEELVWAGKREGNLGGGIILLTFTGFLWYLTINSLTSDSIPWFFLILAFISSYFLVTFPWKLRHKPISQHLDTLKSHKANLRTSSATERRETRTWLQNAMKTFSFWKKLNPQEFEQALTLLLKDEGLMATTTKFSGDGGVDIECVDNTGETVIIQAKKYKGNVGVAVVREMIGVRESREDRPRTVIFSLNGFTRGARELAGQSEIELRDIKSELLRI